MGMGLKLDVRSGTQTEESLQVGADPSRVLESVSSIYMSVSNAKISGREEGKNEGHVLRCHMCGHEFRM
jgi:hypothetical protein